MIKTKRLKKVFSSNSQLAHVWAAQQQDTGRSANMLFDGTSIYSYGFHYCIAQMHGDIVLINSKGYSISTAKHTNEVRRAVTHKTVFYVPEVNSPDSEANILYLQNQVMAQIEVILNGRVVEKDDFTDIYNANYRFASYLKAFKITGRELELDAEFMADLEVIFKEKLARCAELNALKEEKQKAKRLEAEKEHKASIADWKAFKGPIKGYSNEVFMRINTEKGVVETSRGAVVPLKEALITLAQIKSGKPVVGQRVGDFEIDLVNETMVKVGCHDIPMAEIDAVFGQGFKLVA